MRDVLNAMMATLIRGVDTSKHGEETEKREEGKRKWENSKKHKFDRGKTEIYSKNLFYCLQRKQTCPLHPQFIVSANTS